jgi:hypothetical protein
VQTNRVTEDLRTEESCGNRATWNRVVRNRVQRDTEGVVRVAVECFDASNASVRGGGRNFGRRAEAQRLQRLRRRLLRIVVGGLVRLGGGLQVE